MTQFIFILVGLVEGRWIPECPPRWTLAEAEADMEAATPASRPIQILRYRLTDQLSVRRAQAGERYA